MGLPKGRTNNPKGRTKGSKTKKTKEWEALAESITGHCAEKFRNYVDQLWSSQDPKDKDKAATLYLQTLEYFKPKQQRVESTVDSEVVVIVKHES